MVEVGTTSVRSELLDASDETIADAVSYADPMVLRGLLYQLTGDEELIEVRLVSGAGQRVAPEGAGAGGRGADGGRARPKCGGKRWRGGNDGPFGPDLLSFIPIRWWRGACW